MVILALAVPAAAAAACLQTFACDTLEELGTTFLRADYSLECYTPEHKLYRAYAGIMILVRLLVVACCCMMLLLLL